MCDHIDGGQNKFRGSKKCPWGPFPNITICHLNIFLHIHTWAHIITKFHALQP
jgi:hypothetical protein